MNKKLLTAIVASATLFSATSFASTTWDDYLVQVEAQVNDYDANAFANIKTDPSLIALENAIAKTLMEMKTYAASKAPTKRATTMRSSAGITDVAGYLKSLEAELSSVIIPISLKADPEFAKMEAELILLMAILQKAQ